MILKTRQARLNLLNRQRTILKGQNKWKGHASFSNCIWRSASQNARKKDKYNLLCRYVGSLRNADLVFATSHGFFGENTELLTLSSEPFEISLVNSTALRPTIQNLWQEVTIIKTSSFPDESKPAQKVSNCRRSLRFSDWSVSLIALMSLVHWKRLTFKPPHGRKGSSFGGIFLCWSVVLFLFFPDFRTLHLFAAYTGILSLKHGSWMWFSNKATAKRVYFTLPVVGVSTSSSSQSL